MHAEIIRDQGELDRIATEWDDLYERCPRATPFQSHAWNAAWARAYCEAGELRVVVVRESGALVGLAPLRTARRGGWRVLTPLGGPITDYVDVLVTGDRGDFFAALNQVLLSEPGWSVIDLPELRPEATAWEWAASWPASTRQVAASTSLELPVLLPSQMLARLPARTAGGIRRKLRRVDAAGVEVALVPPERAREAVPALLALHEEQWRGRGVNPEHVTPRFEAFLTEATCRMAHDERAVVVEYRLDGEVLGMQMDLVGHGFLGYYLAGFSPRLKERVDITSMMTRADLHLARDRGVGRYSMLRGREEPKLRWRPEEVPGRRLLLCRPAAPTSWAYVALVGARDVATAWARRRAPWLGPAKRRLDRARRTRAAFRMVGRG